MLGGYTSIVARLPCWYSAFVGLAVSIGFVSSAQDQSQSGKLKDRKKEQQQLEQQKEQEPPEEDPGLKEKEYSFNPLQAQKDLSAGSFYYKKGNYKAAARRFREAAKWDPTSADALLRLAQAEEKLKDDKAAHDAYQKYLELAPDSKDADSIKKKLARHR